MRVAVLSGKGGAGKTFVAVNLAAVAGTDLIFARAGLGRHPLFFLPRQ